MNCKTLRGPELLAFSLAALAVFRLSAELPPGVVLYVEDRGNRRIIALSLGK